MSILETRRRVRELPGQTAPPTAPIAAEPEPKFEVSTSREFESWLTEQRINLAFTTYQVGKLFFLGIGAARRLSVFNRTLGPCMGLAYGDGALWVATHYQVLKLVDVGGRQHLDGNYDCVFAPQVSYYAGDIDARDLAVTLDGKVLFANTLFSCVATVSETHSFKSIWMPSFIDRLAAEDRCHLNGLALDNGALRYVTAAAESDVADGWRDYRAKGGIVIDCQSGEIVGRGLSMPHSPRFHKGRLYLLNSGTGHFGTLDPNTGEFEAIAFCPGYLRGLNIVGNFGVIGVSKPRNNRTFPRRQSEEAWDRSSLRRLRRRPDQR
jgi:uncharacterized protein (TIGR03032 family)